MAKMLKQIDFAAERRAQGRSLSRSVHELAAVIQSLTDENGIELQARLNKTLAQKSEERQLLAKRLQESVLPLFTMRRGNLDRIGSCVLVRLDSDFFAFTAAHVLQGAESARLFAPSEGGGGKLLPLPTCTAHLKSSGRANDLDVGVLFLEAEHLGSFEQHVFLTDTEIDTDGRLDDQSLKSSYVVFGYPASRTQFKIQRIERRIYQRSFHCFTSPVNTAEYLQEHVSQTAHILLDFDHKEILVQGRRVDPPKLQGVSGGGIFHISRATHRGPLVAIATENKRKSRLIMGTRIKHFLELIRELKTVPRL